MQLPVTADCLPVAIEMVPWYSVINGGKMVALEPRLWGLKIKSLVLNNEAMTFKVVPLISVVMLSSYQKGV